MPRRRPIVGDIDDFYVDKWFERDRAYVALVHERTGKRVLEFWDEDVNDIVDSGFLDPRDWHGSMFEYAKYLGIIKEKRRW